MNIEPMPDLLLEAACAAGAALMTADPSLTGDIWMLCSRQDEESEPQAFFHPRKTRLNDEASKLLRAESGALKDLEDFLPKRRSDLWMRLDGKCVVRWAFDEPETVEALIPRGINMCPVLEESDFFILGRLESGQELYPTSDGSDYLMLCAEVGELAADIAKKLPPGRIQIVELPEGRALIHTLKRKGGVRERSLIGIMQ